ncbi:hypothetical protein KIW84_045823 [Lathyrus oleraceus]|uniref:Uncharacterized protein n=1 Tax=Pisum sativum TaxID=3888 RepID=A0A9D4XM34_PEA|nr:hypothetical protein KIW84_045823 [Pisum sativum]
MERSRDVDKERATWLRIYEVPCHASNPKFFEFISKSVGVYRCVDDTTREQFKMNAVRILASSESETSSEDLMVEEDELEESVEEYDDDIVKLRDGRVESADDGIGALKDNLTDDFEEKRLWGSETYEVKACQHGAKSNNRGAVNG